MIHKTLSPSLIALAFAAPNLVSASSFYHPAGGEMGFTTHPDHVQSTVSRADVLQSLVAARNDGTLAILSRGGAVPSKATGPGKTREQVQQEYLNMTPAEKQRARELFGTGG